MLFGLIHGGISFNPDQDIPDLAGKVILITGGNIGLGKETVLQLARHNPGHIYILARNEIKALSTIRDIQSLVPSCPPISYIHCDLTSLPSVQSAAHEFTSKESRLDILILNAGIMAVPAATTPQGYEVQFGTNHVGHALLAKLLLPTMEKTAAAAGAQPGAVRIISVSSIGHNYPATGGIAFADLKTDMRGTSTWARYGQSKLANILFVKGLHQRIRDKGIVTVAVHPGVVDTELYTTVFSGWLGLRSVLNWGKSLLALSVQEGSKNQLWAATAPAMIMVGGEGKSEAKGKVLSGEYYTPIALSGQGSRFSEDPELAEKLWQWTEKELEKYN